MYQLCPCSVLPLHGIVKNYHWGKNRQDSIISKFDNSKPTSCVEPPTTQDTPLAEIWFGTHPSGPSAIDVCGQRINLSDFIKGQPDMCGHVNHIAKYGNNLPFLFKILSVGQPLSLQAHPDKTLAGVLHGKDPRNYPDSNHKPEMAIALTEFEVLCDFRCHKQILKFIKDLEPLKKVVGEENYKFYNGQTNDDLLQQGLAKCFTSLVGCDKFTVASELKSLRDHHISGIDKDLADVFTRLHNLYPQDPGCFAIFFLNHIKLSPGQGIFLEANKLHAYISGECIECMACSDNVVRAGLTSKFCDVNTLTKMLNYQPRNPHDIILKPKRSSDHLTVYKPPIDEFAVDRIEVDRRNGGGPHKVSSVSSGSIMIVLSGSAKMIDFLDNSKKHKIALGSVAYVPPQVSPTLIEISGLFTAYRAYC